MLDYGDNNPICLSFLFCSSYFSLINNVFISFTTKELFLLNYYFSINKSLISEIYVPIFYNWYLKLPQFILLSNMKIINNAVSKFMSDGCIINIILRGIIRVFVLFRLFAWMQTKVALNLNLFFSLLLLSVIISKLISNINFQLNMLVKLSI